MSGFTPVNQGYSQEPKEALHESRSNRIRHIVNSDEQIAMLNGSGYPGTSHPDDDNDHFADTTASQDGHNAHQVASQANDNETTTDAKTLALLHSHNDTIERWHASLSNLQDAIKAQRDHFYDIHRSLPSYDLGPVIRPRLFPSRGGNSIFKGHSSPPFDIPKPTAPCTPLRILPTHPLTEAGVISVHDCQHMYEAGLSGKHYELKDVYLAVANAPGNQSLEFYGDKLHPIRQQSPGGLQGLVDVRNKILGTTTDRLWQAEPGTSLQGPTEKWAKETIGAFPPAVENGARNTRVYENRECFAQASAVAVEALGAEKEHGDTNCNLEAVTGHQKAIYGNSEDLSGHGGQANGDHRGLRDGLYVIGNGYRAQAHVDHPSVNGGSHSTASTPPPPLTNVHSEHNAEGHDPKAELFRRIAPARPSINGHDSAIAGAHEVFNGDHGLHDGIQDDHSSIIVVHYRDRENGGGRRQGSPHEESQDDERRGRSRHRRVRR